MKRDKVLVVAQLPPPHHGSNVMAQQFVETLAGLGYQVVFADKALSRSAEEQGKVSVRKLVSAVALVVKVGWRAVTTRPPLGVYFLSVDRLAFLLDAACLLVLRACRTRYVLYCHGRGFQALRHSGRLMRGIVDTTLKGAAGCAVLGERLIVDVSPPADPRTVTVIPNGIPFSARPSRCAVSGTITVLFLSNIQPDKGAMEFLQIAKIVAGQRDDVRFVLAGRCPSAVFEAQLRRFVEENGLNSSVEFVGAVYGSDKERLFASSDIFLFPTRHAVETFGLVNLEAMRAALPVISTNQGAIPEVVRQGVNGLIADSAEDVDLIAEYVLDLCADPAKRRAFGENGRDIFESTYTLEHYRSRVGRALAFYLGA